MFALSEKRYADVLIFKRHAVVCIKLKFIVKGDYTVSAKVNQQ